MPACGTAPPSPTIRLMTHFASADDARGSRHPRARSSASPRPPGVSACERSFCNSAGVLAWPEAHAEWIRPGVMLYGISPMAGRTGPDEGLRPVMTLTTAPDRRASEVPAGEAVGYAGTWRAATRQPDRHRRHRLWRRLPAPRALRHAGPGQRPPQRHGRPRLDGHAGGRPRATSPTPRSATRSCSGARACPPSTSPTSCRHHRLRAALRPRRPRPHRGARRP